MFQSSPQQIRGSAVEQSGRDIVVLDFHLWLVQGHASDLLEMTTSNRKRPNRYK